jgi:(p)ppGpp synthase/HD superfamily hydrolase
MNQILKAAQYAESAHKGQTRKYNKVPYVTHCAMVAGLVSTRPWATEDLVTAAWLHDTLEDCPQITEQSIKDSFNPNVLQVVKGLTNPSKNYPELPRKERKAMDREHLRHLPPTVQAIKLADRYCNLSDLLRDNAPKDFKILYAEESRALADMLTDGMALDPELAKLFNEVLKQFPARQQIGL